MNKFFFLLLIILCIYFFFYKRKGFENFENINDRIYKLSKNKNLCAKVQPITYNGIRYGENLMIKNHTGYLGSCGKDSICGYKFGNLGVYTYTDRGNSILNNNPDSFMWVIKNANPNIRRREIFYNDKVIIYNDPDVMDYWLETCSMSNSKNILDKTQNKPYLSTSLAKIPKDKGNNAIYWTIVGPTEKETGPIQYGNTILLKNEWGLKSYLNTCKYENLICELGDCGVDNNCKFGFQSKVNPCKKKKNYNDISWQLIKPIKINESKTSNNLILYKSNKNYCLTVEGIPQIGSNIIVTKYLGGNNNPKNQEWIYENGYLKLKSNLNYCIGLLNSSISNNTAIKLDIIKPFSDKKGFESQQWLVKNNIIFLKKNKSFVITLAENQVYMPNSVVLYKLWKYNIINSSIESQRWIVPNEIIKKDKCNDLNGWFSPYEKTYLNSENSKIKKKLNNISNYTCYKNCLIDEDCDYYGFNNKNNSCNLYSISNSGEIQYNNVEFNDSQFSGKIKRKSICKKKLRLNKPKETLKNINLCNKCTFPEFKNKCARPEFGCNWQNCCPESWSNSSYGAKPGVSCGTGIIQKRESWGDPIKSCQDAGGFVIQTKKNPPEYACSNKEKKGILHYIQSCNQCSPKNSNLCENYSENSPDVEEKYIIGEPLLNGNTGLTGYDCSNINNLTSKVRNSKTGKVYAVENLNKCDESYEKVNNYCKNLNLNKSKLLYARKLRGLSEQGDIKPEWRCYSRQSLNKDLMSFKQCEPKYYKKIIPKINSTCKGIDQKVGDGGCNNQCYPFGFKYYQKDIGCFNNKSLAQSELKNPSCSKNPRSYYLTKPELSTIWNDCTDINPDECFISNYNKKECEKCYKKVNKYCEVQLFNTDAYIYARKLPGLASQGQSKPEWRCYTRNSLKPGLKEYNNISRQYSTNNKELTKIWNKYSDHQKPENCKLLTNNE